LTRTFCGGTGTITLDEKLFCRISRSQDSAKGLNNTVDIFEQLFDKDKVQKIATEPNCYGQQFKNSRAIPSLSGRG